jgi:hypothetical protein
VNGLSNFIGGLRQNVHALAGIMSVTIGIFTFLGSARLITGIMGTVKAIRELTVALRTLGVVGAVSEALASGGMSAVTAAAGAAAATVAALGAFAYLDKQLGKSLGNVSGGLPDNAMAGVGAGGAGGGGTPWGIAGLLQGALPGLAKFGIDIVTEMRDRDQRYLAAIEKNTRDTADVLSLRKQGIGGGALAGVGVTATELRRGGVSGNAPGRGDWYARPASTELERLHSRLIRRELNRQNGRGRELT